MNPCEIFRLTGISVEDLHVVAETQDPIEPWSGLASSKTVSQGGLAVYELWADCCSNAPGWSGAAAGANGGQ